MVKEFLLKDMVIKQLRQKEQRKHQQKSPKLNQMGREVDDDIFTTTCYLIGQVKLKIDLFN